jgi:ParB-like chromosome segregation protein Spo0J
MNPLPPLSDEERGRLRASIMQDGVVVPVLHDARGTVIDGHHRKELAEELGIDYPTQTIDVDQETADRLRLTLNWARRQMTTIDQHELLARLARKHWPAAAAEARERMLAGKSDPKDTVSLGSSKKAQTRDVVAERINADLAAAGETKRVTGKTVERAQATARLPESAKRQVRCGEVSLNSVHPYQSGSRRKDNPKPQKAAPKPAPVSQPDVPDLGSAARIRAVDAEMQFRSMLNAPPAKLNLPLVRRAEKVQELLTELIGLDPAVAVTQLPPERCRDFTPTHAEWWAEFTALCEKRRQEETPQLAPRPYRPPNATLNPVVVGTADLPKEERHLQPNERAVLDWLRVQDEPATITQIAIGLRVRSKDAIQTRIRTLAASGLVEIAGKAGRETAYRATPSG